MIEEAIEVGDDQTQALMDDETLIQAILRSPDLFALLYRRYVRQVYRYAMARLGSRQMAEDLTSQVFIDLLESLPRYQPNGHFTAWLFTIVRRRTIDAIRKQRPHAGGERLESLGQVGEDPLQKMIHQEALHRLAELYDALSGEQKELIRLRFAAGLTYGEMGRVLGRREATVRMAMHRLLRRLKKRWEADHD